MSPDISEGGSSDGDPLRLSNQRLERIENELRLSLDPHLAGLLRKGVAYALSVSDEGTVYLLAHAGRELSLGVLRHLEAEAGLKPPPRGKSNDDGPGHQKRIAAVLGVEPKNQLAARWFDIHQVLVSSAHHQLPSPGPARVRAAFEDLLDMVRALVGPYFDTHRELQSLVVLDSPTAADVKRAIALLVLPIQRNVFYRRLQSVAWLASLADAGHFSSPPNLARDGEKWTVQPWPERTFLIAAAADASEAVRDIFLAIPEGNTNPLVWSAAAEAACRMPPTVAAPVGVRIAGLLSMVPQMLLAHHAIRLATHLAVEETDSAFQLVQALLFLRKEDPTFDSTQSTDPFNLRRVDTKWMLAAIDTHELGEIARTTLPALARADAERALRLVCTRLRLAERGMRARQGLERDEDHSSQYWCENLSWWKSALDHGDVRAILATTMWTIVRREFLSGARSSRVAFTILGEFHEDIFARARILLLALSEGDSSSAISELLSDENVLRSRFGTTEIAELLERKFSACTPAAKHALVEAVRRGPSDKEILWVVGHRRHGIAQEARQATYDHPDSIEEVTDGERIEVVNAWKARRLALFGATVPAEFREIAEEIAPQLRDARDSRAESRRISVTGASPDVFEGPAFPHSVADLAVMSDEGIVATVGTWDAETRRRERHRNAAWPATEALATAHVERIPSLIRFLSASDIAIPYLSAILSASRNTAREKKVFPWREFMEASPGAVAAAAAAFRTWDTSAIAMRAGWIDVVDSLMEIVKEGISGGLLSPDDAGSLHGFLEQVLDFYEEFQHAPEPLFRTSEEETGTVGSKLLPGLVGVIAIAAYWGTEVEDEALQRAVSLEDRLNRLLVVEGDARWQVLEAIGRYLHYLVSSNPEWVGSKSSVLFPDDPASDVVRGALASFLTHNRYFSPILRLARPAYSRLAGALGEEKLGAPPGGTGRDLLSANLVDHIGRAWTEGLVADGEEDGLAESVFAVGPVEARSRVYWSLFRGLTDATSDVSSVFVARCMRLWRWRLEVLEQLSASPERQSEATGLTWLISTPHLPFAERAELALRTLGLNPDGVYTAKFLRSLCESNPEACYPVVEAIGRVVLAEERPHLEVADVAPAFEWAISHADRAIRERATSLLHRLSRTVDPRFGELLPPE